MSFCGYLQQVKIIHYMLGMVVFGVEDITLRTKAILGSLIQICAASFHLTQSAAKLLCPQLPSALRQWSCGWPVMRSQLVEGLSLHPLKLTSPKSVLEAF